MYEYGKHLPRNGSVVRLIEPPRGSWAKAGDVVRVSYRPHVRAGHKGIHSNTSVSVWDVERDCGTVDNAVFWRWARWGDVAAA